MNIGSANIASVEIVAAMTPPHSNAAFNRGHLIVRVDDETLLEVRTFRVDGRVEGPVLSNENLDNLLSTGSATRLSCPSDTKLSNGAMLWVLRPKFPRRDQALNTLRKSGTLSCTPSQQGSSGVSSCVVIENEKSDAIRDGWKSDATNKAYGFLRSGDWAFAATEAEIAHAVSRAVDPEVLAILSLAYARCGRAERAEGLFTVARRSRGEDFEQQVVSVRQRLEAELAHERPRVRPHPTLEEALRNHLADHRALGRPHSARLASETADSQAA